MSRRRELYTRSEVVEKLLKDLNDLIALSSIPFAAQDIKNMLLGLSITTSVVTSTIPASIGNVTLLRPNAGRRAASIVNDTTNVLYVKCGTGATTTSYTVKMPINSYFELPQPPWIGQVDALGARGDLHRSEAANPLDLAVVADEDGRMVDVAPAAHVEHAVGGDHGCGRGRRGEGNCRCGGEH